MTSNDLLGYGYLGGSALLGTQDINSEVNNQAQNKIGSKQSPGLFSIPYFMEKFQKQIGVMLAPKKLFIPSTLPDPTPYYQQTNHLQAQPVLVFQSPLQYIGLPNDG